MPLSSSASPDVPVAAAASGVVSGVFVGVAEGVTVAKAGRVGIGVSVPVGVAVGLPTGPSSVIGRVGVEVGKKIGGCVGSGSSSGVLVAGTLVGVLVDGVVVVVEGPADGVLVADCPAVGLAGTEVLVGGTLVAVAVGGTGVFVAGGALVAIGSGVGVRAPCALARVGTVARRQQKAASAMRALAETIKNWCGRFKSNSKKIPASLAKRERLRQLFV